MLPDNLTESLEQLKAENCELKERCLFCNLCFIVKPFCSILGSYEPPKCLFIQQVAEERGRDFR